MKIIFIRHTSVDVPPGTCYGQTDVPLRDTFPEEAAVIKSRLEREHIDAVFSSPLSRCVRLAQFCGFGNPILDPRLMEMDFGEWEMKRFDDIDDPRLQLWYADYLNVAPTGGESSMTQRKRLADFLNDMRLMFSPNSGKTIAIFTHGGIIIHALTLLSGLSYSEALSRQPHYGQAMEMRL